MSGVDLITQLQSGPERADVPVVWVTAHTWDAIGCTAAELGCAAFVGEPVDACTLLEMVEKCLANRPALTG